MQMDSPVSPNDFGGNSMVMAASGNGNGAVAIPRIGLSRYRLRFEAERELRGGGYRGSAWRGVMGHALKKMVCVTRAQTCAGCLLEESCTYPYVFETPTREKGILGRSPAAPHPFVLEVDALADRGRRQETVGLTVIGRGQQHAAYMIHALGQAGACGLRPDEVPLHLVEVSRESQPGSGRWESAVSEDGLMTQVGDAAEAPEAPAALEIAFRTPLRMKRDNDLLTPATFRLADLTKALVRRVAMVAEYHGEEIWAPDFKALMAEAERLDWSWKDLGWKEWTRSSQRQQAEMQMGGIVGRARADGEEWKKWWPLIWLGQWVHAGKATSMGLGRYEVNVAP